MSGEQVQGMAEGEKVKRGKSINIEEFKALVNNLIPTTLKQAEWICSTVERLTHEHPELKRKIEEWGAEQMSESEERELEEIIGHILAEAEKPERERRTWLSKKLKEAHERLPEEKGVE